LLLGTGVDLVEIARIKKLHKKAGDTFLNRVFTSQERKFLGQKGNPYPSMAARFAAKEAVFKALDLRGHGASWQDVTVLTLASGKPFLLLSGQTARRAKQLGVGKATLSLSHSQEMAVAFVCFEKKSFRA
jgi:holo-[acyl-carrier protein] synthase